MWVSKLNASRALQAPDDTTNESSSHRLPATTKDTSNIKTEMVTKKLKDTNFKH